MCIIVAHKVGAPSMPEDMVREAWETNSHGAGIMYVKDGELKIEKPFFKLKDLEERYRAIHGEVSGESPIVVHFRIATHGEKDATNTHPFHVGLHERVGLAHNGVLTGPPSRHGSKYSDTWWFCATVLYKRPAWQIMSDEFKADLEAIIGPSNKLVLLDRKKNLQIVNESAGHWNDQKDTWFSNYSYKKFPTVTQSAFYGAHVDDDEEEDDKKWVRSYTSGGYWQYGKFHPYSSQNQPEESKEPKGKFSKRLQRALLRKQVDQIAEEDSEVQKDAEALKEAINMELLGPEDFEDDSAVRQAIAIVRGFGGI